MISQNTCHNISQIITDSAVYTTKCIPSTLIKTLWSKYHKIHSQCITCKTDYPLHYYHKNENI